MTMKIYNEPDGSTIIDGETGGEPRKVGLLVPKDPPNVFATLAETVPLLSDSEIRKVLDDPNRVNGRMLFGPDYTKDQNGRGACNGYAEAGLLERARVRKGLDRVKMSGDFAYCLMNGGSDSGSMLSDAMQLMLSDGICSEDTVKKHGLVHEYRKNRFPSECFEEAKRYKGLETYHIDTEQEILTALALGFDVCVAVQAGGSGSLDRYGIVQWGNGQGNHSVMIDDAVYDTQLGGYKFDHQNSWGTRWGDNGRSYLTWDRHFRTSVNVHRFYAVRSATDDPQGDNPPAPKGN